jgi:hypothetical protein
MLKLKSPSLLFLLLVFGLVSPFVLKPIITEIKMSYDWREPFREFQNIGDQCKASFLPTAPDQSDSDLLVLGRQSATDFRIPFRSEPKYTALPEKHWTYVGCKVTPPDSSKAYLTPQLYLGPIWGDSVVYIDGSEVRRFSTFASVSIILTKEQLQNSFDLEVVSRNVDNGAGPMSLIPMVLLRSETDLRVVQRTLNYFKTERTLVPLGIASTLALLFLCCWLFGVHYRDVFWMIVACSAAAGSSALQHYPVGDPPSWYYQFRLFIDMICWGALWASIYTFLRKPAKQWQLIAFVSGIALLYQCQWLIPRDMRTVLIGAIDRHDGVWIGPVLLTLAYLSLKIDSEIPPKRLLQRRILGVILVLFGLWVTWAGFYSFRIGFSTDNLTRTTLLALFGAFMIIDLVIFQRAYFEEKSLKEEEVRRRSTLEDRMELGFSIQRLLMPGEQTKAFGPFKVFVFYECADLMAGDWFYWSDADSKLRVLCGDVVGKGPEAAIAATSILTLCHDYTKRSGSLTSVLTSMNKAIVELFRSKPISTLGAAELKMDGSVEVVNHGFPGWMHLKKNGDVEFIGQRGASLGAQVNMPWDTKNIEMGQGDRLIIFSDGVLEGPRAIKLLSDKLKQSHLLSLEQLSEIIQSVGKNSTTIDDKTILIVEKV